MPNASSSFIHVIISYPRRILAASGTRKTFHPKFSKKVHRRACPVVFPPHGPVDSRKREKKKRLLEFGIESSRVRKQGGTRSEGAPSVCLPILSPTQCPSYSYSSHLHSKKKQTLVSRKIIKVSKVPNIDWQNRFRKRIKTSSEWHEMRDGRSYFKNPSTRSQSDIRGIKNSRKSGSPCPFRQGKRGS